MTDKSGSQTRSWREYDVNYKQCENSPTNTIISINFEDHDSDHGIRQIIYK